VQGCRERQGEPLEVMNNMNTTFIYALCDPRDLQVRYIGKSSNIYKRYYGHLYDKDETHKVHWIQSLLRKGLMHIYQILEECDESVWREREINWILFYKNIIKENLTNDTDGGDGGCISFETRKKISDAKKGKSPSMETRKKMSEAAKINRKKIHFGEMEKGHIPWNKGKKGFSHSTSEETRKKISKTLTGKIHSDETKLKMSQSQKQRWNKIIHKEGVCH
jgi:hypothetical protein